MIVAARSKFKKEPAARRSSLRAIAQIGEASMREVRLAEGVRREELAAACAEAPASRFAHMACVPGRDLVAVRVSDHVVEVRDASTGELVSPASSDEIAARLVAFFGGSKR